MDKCLLGVPFFGLPAAIDVENIGRDNYSALF
jgi:hypothetical protein